MHRHPGYHRRQIQQSNKTDIGKPLPGYHRRRAWALDCATYTNAGFYFGFDLAAPVIGLEYPRSSVSCGDGMTLAGPDDLDCQGQLGEQ